MNFFKILGGLISFFIVLCIPVVSQADESSQSDRCSYTDINVKSDKNNNNYRYKVTGNLPAQAKGGYEMTMRLPWDMEIEKTTVNIVNNEDKIIGTATTNIEKHIVIFTFNDSINKLHCSDYVVSIDGEYTTPEANEAPLDIKNTESNETTTWNWLFYVSLIGTIVLIITAISLLIRNSISKRTQNH